MSLTTLVTLSPRRPADGVAEVHRFVHNARDTGRFMGQQWRPDVIRSLPDFELDLGFADGKFGQGATPQVGQLVLAVGRDSPLSSMIWVGSTVILRSASWPAGLADASDSDFGAPATYVVETMAVTADGALTLTLLDNGQALRSTLLSARFGSTANPLLDGAGAVDHAGKVVPMGWGKCLNVPAMLVDRVYNIWLLIGRPTSVFHGVFDGGAPFGAGVVRADLAALRANTPADGTCDVCGNAGGLTLVRPWTTPTYPLTADITASGPQTAGDIALALVAMRSSIDVSAGAAAFNALYPGQAQLFVNDERTAATALDQLVSGLGAYWKVLSGGQFELGRLDFAAPLKSFAAHELISVEREAIVMPNRRRAVGWGHNNRPHGEAEIAGILRAEDISGLGALALLDNLDWALVTGAGRPADSATRNADAGNLIPDPITLSDMWSSSAYTVRDALAGGGRLADRYRIRSLASGGVYQYAGWTAPVAAGIQPFPVSPGETLHGRHSVFNGLGATGESVALLNILDADFTYLMTLELVGTRLDAGTSTGVWQTVSGSVLIPEGAAFAWPHIAFLGRTAGQVLVGEPYLGRAAPGADVTGENTAQNTLNVGSQSAAALVADAATALAGAASALSSISIIVSDGYLSRGEKPAAIKEWTAIDDEYAVIAARAATLAVTGHDSYTAWANARTALNTYLAGLTPAWNNTAADTPIVATTFRGKFTDYYYARQLLLDLFTATAKSAADAAQTTADSKTRNVWVGMWDDVAIGFTFSIGEEVERYGSSWTVTAAHTKMAVNGPPLPPAASNANWSLRTKAGADGVSTFAVTPSLPTWTVPCDSAGAPLADAFTGATGRLQCRYAGADVTASCTFAALTHTAAAGSIDSAGNYTITDIGGLVGKLVFRATYDPPGAAPVEQVDIIIQVLKSIRGAAAIEVADNSILRPTSSNMVVSNELVIPAGPGGSISISATAGFFGTDGGSSANVQMKAQKRLAGTGDPYVDVTGYVTGSLPSVKDVEGIWNGGSAAYSTSVSGPAAQEFWQIRLMASPVGTLSAGGWTGTFKVSRSS